MRLYNILRMKSLSVNELVFATSVLLWDLGMLSVTHIMPVLVLNTCMDANMQLAINSIRQLIRDKIFSQPSIYIEGC